MILKTGNVLDTPIEIIAHQVNCQGVMGAGLAKQIKDKYPKVCAWYRTKCHKHSFGLKTLGTGQIVPTDDGHTFFNIFAQAGYGTTVRQTDYDAFKSAFVDAINTYRFFANEALSNLEIAIPYKIGCGLAGGDWKVISAILEQIEKECNVTFYIYKLRSD